MSYNLSNVPLGGQATGENTASGAEFCLDRGVGQVQHRDVVIDSTATDAFRNPSTLLEVGLVLVKNASTGRWAGVANGSTSATDKMGVLDEPVNMLDPNGVAQNTAPKKLMIRGLVDAARVRDKLGAAIDSTGRTGLATGTNGCNFMFSAA